MRLRHVPFLWIVLVGSTALAEYRPAAAILAELETTKPPEMPGFKNKADMKDFVARRDKAIDRRAELIGELYRAHPDAPELAKLLPEQWESRLGTRVFDPLLKLEIEEVIARSKDDSLVRTACFYRVIGEIGRYPALEAKTEDLLKAVDVFTARYPKDALGGELMQNVYLTRPTFEDQETVFRRLAAEYPNSKALYQVNYARNAILGDRRLKAMIGKPYPLDFTDPITGAKVNDAGLKGKVVVVDFRIPYATKGYVDVSALKKLLAAHKAEGFEVVGVMADGPDAQGGRYSLDSFKAWTRRDGADWPQWFVAAGQVSEFAELHNHAAVLVLGRDGLVAAIAGPMDLTKEVERVLARSPKL